MILNDEKQQFEKQEIETSSSYKKILQIKSRLTVHIMYCMSTDNSGVWVSLCVGSSLHVWLINWVTQTEGERDAKGRDRERKSERAMPLMHACSLPVWLWRTVTLFAWLVEPLGHDWPCYITPPLSSSFLSSLIYQSYSAAFLFLPFFPSSLKKVWQIFKFI